MQKLRVRGSVESNYHARPDVAWRVATRDLTYIMDAIRFLATYSGFNIAQPSASASGDVQIQGKDGIVTGLATVSRYIIGDKLKASTPELDAQVRRSSSRRL